MLKFIYIGVLIASTAWLPNAALARQFNTMPDSAFQISANAYPIHQAEAAMIAKSANPGSTVLSVRLLPSGVYAVTLKVSGSLREVMVDATTGAIS